MKTAVTWGIAVVAVFWVIVIATHIEWVRQHDGPIVPISYFLAVVISLLVAGLLLSLYVLGARRPAESAVDQGGMKMPSANDSFYLRVGQTDRANASPAGADAVRPDPRDSELSLLVLSKTAYANRDLQVSATGFKKLVNSPAYAADAFYGLGMIALAQGRRQEAEKLFTGCLRADPAYANAWYQLGRLRESHSPAEALKSYREALRLNPQHAGAMRKLGAGPGAGLAGLAGVASMPDAFSALPARGVAANAGPDTAPEDQRLAAPSGHIRGRVVGFQRRAEQSFFLHRLYLYVWDFRVENPGIPPVMIEMRGFRFRGDISNGDVVDITARDASPGRVLRVRRLLNLTTNAEITTSYGRGPRTLAAIAKVAAALIFLAVVISIAALIIHSVKG